VNSFLNNPIVFVVNASNWHPDGRFAARRACIANLSLSNARPVVRICRREAGVLETRFFVGGIMPLVARKRALEMVATGESLTAVFEELCETTDAQSPKIFSFVMLADRSREHLRLVAGKRVPSDFGRAINPTPIGPSSGSWGAAAFFKKRVVVSDVARDPLWADFRDSALSHGLQSAWSQPIVAKNGEVLGAFGICSTDPCTPSDDDLDLLESASHIVTIAIDGQRAEETLKGNEERRRRLADAHTAEPNQVDEKLRRNERRLREVIETIPAMAWSTFPDGKVDFANQRWAEYTGPSLTDMSGLGWKKAIHPEDFDGYQEQCHISLTTGTAFESEVRIRRSSDGEYRWFLNRAVALRGEQGEIVGWYGTATDIEDSKRAQAALRKSEYHLAEAQRLTRTGSWAWSVATEQFVYWSREHYHLFGFEPDGGPPSVEAFFMRIHSDDRSTVRASFSSHVLRTAASLDLNFRVALPDGTLKHIHSIGHPVRDASGGPVEYVGTSVDVTEEHEARAALETAFAEIKKLKDQLFEENNLLREEVDRTSMFEEIVGESPALQVVLSRISKVAPIDSTVLITGETGTGKELTARAIHRRSRRAARAFVSVNCSAIPCSLIASELFGHEKGAFTGATDRRLGRFELADGGTIFLDEVGELCNETQVALLRVLQEREFERIGSSKVVRSNVRVLAATNRDLKAAVEAGSFRSDLYYRLNVFPVHMPSLRQRREDIPVLVEYFIGRFAAKAGKHFGTISKATLDQLCSYGWPGNIRELQNVIERSVIVCETENFVVDNSWLSTGTAETDRAVRPLLKISASQEKKLIEDALAEAQGRVAGATGAAAKLGIPPSTLESKIAVLKINKHRFRRA